MKNTFLSLSVLASLALWISGCNSSNSSTDQEARNDDTITVDQTTEQVIDDQTLKPIDMVYYVYMNNYMQTTLGNIAEQKAASEKVKDLGKNITEENTQIMSQIEDLAKASDVELPQGLEVEDQQRLDSLTALSGQQFDLAYVNMVIEQKNKSIELMQDMALNAENPIVSGLVDDIIATEREQIQRAETVQQEMM